MRVSFAKRTSQHNSRSSRYCFQTSAATRKTKTYAIVFPIENFLLFGHWIMIGSGMILCLKCRPISEHMRIEAQWILKQRKSSRPMLDLVIVFTADLGFDFFCDRQNRLLYHCRMATLNRSHCFQRTFRLLTEQWRKDNWTRSFSKYFFSNFDQWLCRFLMIFSAFKLARWQVKVLFHRLRSVEHKNQFVIDAKSFRPSVTSCWSKSNKIAFNDHNGDCKTTVLKTNRTEQERIKMRNRFDHGKEF